jgi:hypothetical protein
VGTWIFGGPWAVIRFTHLQERLCIDIFLLKPDSKCIYQVAQQVKVKATFIDDMINFRFPISSGLLAELETKWH